MASPSRSRKKPLFSGTRKFVKNARAKTRAAKQRTSKAQKQLAAGFNQNTGEQYCVPCKKWVPNNGWAAHVASHSLAQGDEKPGERRRGSEPTRQPTERDRERQRRSSGVEEPPQQKTAWKGRNARNRQIQKDIQDTDQQKAQAWDDQQKRINAMANDGNGAMPPVCAALAQSAQKWGDYMPNTRAEMEEFLFGSSNMFKVFANSCRQISQNFVAAKLHPAITRPIDNVGDTLEEERLEFTRSYVILCRIYHQRIEYEEMDGPKPGDGFWKVG